MSKIGIGERMKINYEHPYRTYLPMRMPVIIRLDGKCFHSLSKQLIFEKPFDFQFYLNMRNLALFLLQEIHGSQFAYLQSDEISILLHNYKKLDSQAWFGNNIQKMCSVSAGLASSWMSRKMYCEAVFDARVFVLPEAEVVNYFVWRQQDATRNSVNALAQSHFSHKQLHGLNNSQLQDKLMEEKEINWNDIQTWKKRGACVYRELGGVTSDREIPIFTQCPQYIDKFLAMEEE